MITGRHYSQDSIIIEKLVKKGYCIHEYIFDTRDKQKFPYFNPNANQTIFMIDYWYWKLTTIENLSRKFSKTVIIDDDIVLCASLKKLKFTILNAILSESALGLRICLIPNGGAGYRW